MTPLKSTALTSLSSTKTTPPRARLILCASLCATLVGLSACGGSQSSLKEPQTGRLKAKTLETQARLGPIQGEVTKGKILDRLEGYELCGLTDPVQRSSLRFRFTPIKRGWQLIEVECFFFAIQGLYQVLAVQPSTGQVTPPIFQGAPPAPAQLSQSENKSAVYVNQGRYELCGNPSFDPKTETLITTCKGNADGSCGVYNSYTIEWNGNKSHTPLFKLNELRAHSCALPSTSRDPQDWPKLN